MVLRPETKTKALWYLLFTSLGLFHAEVLSWNEPDVLYNPLRFALVAPVYGVHYLLFGDLLVRARRDDWKTVYVFGCLTGMYETFITKVYWVPPWNPDAAGPLGVAWFELLWIGFTWHAFMAFLVPFRLASRLGPWADGRRRLPSLYAAPALVGGLFAFAFGRPLPEIVLSLALSLLVILVLAAAFLRQARRHGLRDRAALGLGPRGRRFAWGAFLAVYVVYGALLRPEHLPLGLPLLPVLLLYGGLLLLAWRQLRRRPGPDREAPPAGTWTPRKYLLTYASLFPLATGGFGAVHLAAPGLLPLVAIGVMIAGAGLPLLLFPWLLWGLRVRRREDAAAKEGAPPLPADPGAPRPNPPPGEGAAEGREEPIGPTEKRVGADPGDSGGEDSARRA